MEKTTVKKSSYNLIFGIISQVITIAFGILLPRLVLVGYGSEVNGLLNSVTQIFAYFSLLEAGVSSVAVQSLYKTVGEENVQETNAILAAVHKYYKRTGYLYLVAVIALAVIYPIVVDSTISWWIIVAVILFNGSGSVLNYFSRAKYNLLLQAEGAFYIITNVDTSVHILNNIAKIVLLMNGFNVVAVQFASMIFSFLQTAVVLVYIKKKYKWIDLTVEPDRKALAQSKNAMVHQIGTLVFYNTDSILLTLFAGLSQVSVYAMYGLLFGMIKTAISTVTSSTTFVLGQTFNTDREKFRRMHNAYETFFIGLVFALFTVAGFFILPFLKLYTAGVTDADYFMPYLPLLFTIVSVLTYIRIPSNNITNFAKHYKETQWRCILETGINLLVSIALVIPFGIYGVLIGTIVALLYRANDMIVYAAKRVMHTSCWSTYRRCLYNIVVFIAIQLINTRLSFDLSSYWKIILTCIPYMIVVFIIYFIPIIFVEKDALRYVKELIRKIFNKHSRRNREEKNVQASEKNGAE